MCSNLIQALKRGLNSSIDLRPSSVATLATSSATFSSWAPKMSFEFESWSAIFSSKRDFWALGGVLGETFRVLVDFLMNLGEFFGGRPLLLPNTLVGLEAST